MQIFDFIDYKLFLNAYIHSLPKQGRGQARRMAEHLKVSSVVISQILSGDRHFNPEHGLQVAQFIGLDERSTEYFLTMIHRARAGTKSLETYYEKRLKQLKGEAVELKNYLAQIREHKELTDQEKSVFYSNWYYSGISLATSIEGLNTIDALATYFGMSRAKVAEVVEFLLRHGLCQETGGKLAMGITTTYIDSSSTYVNGHRRNWRTKALEKFTEPGKNDLFYSAPYSLSTEDVEIIRQKLAATIGEVSKTVRSSDCEKLACLNIDFFEF